MWAKSIWSKLKINIASASNLTQAVVAGIGRQSIVGIAEIRPRSSVIIRPHVPPRVKE